MLLPMIESCAVSSRPQAYWDRLSVALGGVGAGLVLGKVIQLPARQFGFNALGSPLGVELTTPWVVTAFAAGLAVAGAQSLFAVHPCCQEGRASRNYVHWVLPGLTALATGAALPQIENVQAWAAVMILGIVALGLVMDNEYRSLDPSGLQRPEVHLLTAGAIHGLALVLFLLISRERARELLSGPAVFVVSGLLAIRFFWSAVQRAPRVGLYGVVVGLIMSQAVWAVNYWQLGPLPGGLLLLLIFYLSTGIAQQYLLNQMSRRVLVEHGVVALVAAAVILVWAA